MIIIPNRTSVKLHKRKTKLNNNNKVQEPEQVKQRKTYPRLWMSSSRPEDPLYVYSNIKGQQVNHASIWMTKQNKKKHFVEELRIQHNASESDPESKEDTLEATTLSGSFPKSRSFVRNSSSLRRILEQTAGTFPLADSAPPSSES